MKKHYYFPLILSIVTVSLILSGCSTKKEKAASSSKLTVSAAASLKEPLNKLVDIYNKENKADVVVNYGGSGILQKQIEQGAPVDLFISAGKAQMDSLEKENLLEANSRKDFLENSLVLVVSNSYGKDLKSINELKDKDAKIALGEIKTVPAGQYAAEYLKSQGIMDSFKNKIIYCKDVNEVLTYVESGNVMAGFIYKSDAVNLKNSYIAYEVPDNTHEPIIYPSAVLNQSKNKKASSDFLEFLSSKKAQEVFKSYNFKVKAN